MYLKERVSSKWKAVDDLFNSSQPSIQKRCACTSVNVKSQSLQNPIPPYLLRALVMTVIQNSLKSAKVCVQKGSRCKAVKRKSCTLSCSYAVADLNVSLPARSPVIQVSLCCGGPGHIASRSSISWTSGSVRQGELETKGPSTGSKWFLSSNHQKALCICYCWTNPESSGKLPSMTIYCMSYCIFTEIDTRHSSSCLCSTFELALSHWTCLEDSGRCASSGSMINCAGVLFVSRASGTCLPPFLRLAVWRRVPVSHHPSHCIILKERTTISICTEASSRMPSSWPNP